MGIIGNGKPFTYGFSLEIHGILLITIHYDSVYTNN